jgi:hypothetical protein
VVLEVDAKDEVEVLAVKRSRYRLRTVGTRLTEEEFKRFHEHAEERQMSYSDVIREMILGEVQRPKSGCDPVLAEVVGVRLLLVNLLRVVVCGEEQMSREKFAEILNRVQKLKREVASELGVAK